MKIIVSRSTITLGVLVLCEVFSQRGLAIPTLVPGSSDPCSTPGPHDTRGTNPYQDLKDALNNVEDDLGKAAEAAKAVDAKKEIKAGVRNKKRWASLVAEFGKQHIVLPAEMEADISDAIDKAANKKKLEGPRRMEKFLKAQKLVNALSMTMNCQTP